MDNPALPGRPVPPDPTRRRRPAPATPGHGESPGIVPGRRNRTEKIRPFARLCCRVPAIGFSGADLARIHIGQTPKN